MQKNDTKKKILKVARKQFSAVGYQAATMTAIAAAVDIKKSSLYYFFDSKADLFFQVIHAVLREQREIFSADTDVGGSKERLAAAIEESVERGLESGHILQVPAILSDEVPEKTLTEIREEGESVLETITAFCRACGVADPEHAAHVIIDTSRGFIVRKNNGDAKLSPAEHAQMIADLLHEG